MAVFSAQFLLLSGVWLAARRATVLPGFRGDLLAALANAAVFFGLFSVTVRRADHQGFMLLCGSAIALAAYHAAIGAAVLRREHDDQLRRFAYLGLALTFVTIAIPLQLRASSLTVAWAAESAVLVWTGAVVRERRLRWYGLALLLIAAAKALLLDLPTHPARAALFLNPRMLSGVAVSAAAYISAWLLARARASISQRERTFPTTLAIFATAFIAIFVSLDLWQHGAAAWPLAGRPSARHFLLSLFWSALGTATLAIGVRCAGRPYRIFALTVLAITMCKLFLADLALNPSPFRLILNTRFLASAAFVLAASVAGLLLRKRDSLPEHEARLSAVFCFIANLVLLVFGSLDLWHHVGRTLPPLTRTSGQQLALSCLWSLYALIGLSVGIWRRSRPVRLSFIGLLYLAILKVFLFDLSFLQQPYRIISFVALGIVLLIVSLLYTRYVERLT